MALAAEAIREVSAWNRQNIR